jgi:hypothetical protein
MTIWHGPAAALLLAASICGTAVAATPTIHMPETAWKSNGDSYICQSATCGKGSVISYTNRAAIPYLDGLAQGPNFSAKAMINIVFRYMELKGGYGPFNITSAATRHVKDYIEVLGSGTVKLDGKLDGIAVAILTGSGDDVVLISIGGNTFTAAHNLAVALNGAGF